MNIYSNVQRFFGEYSNHHRKVFSLHHLPTKNPDEERIL